MLKKNFDTFLLVGVDLVGIAHSAKKAGYKVYAADYFGDVDLGEACNKSLSTIDQQIGKTSGRISSNYDPNDFVRMAKSLTKGGDVDAILLSSGLDDNFDVLHELNEIAPILGNPPDTIKAVREKGKLFNDLKRLKVPHPQSAVVDTIEAAWEKAHDIGFPIVFKPLEGFGGFGVRKVENELQFERLFNEVNSFSSRGVLIQKFVEGTHASISFVASEKGAEVLSLNQQLLGLREVYQNDPFGYCGNIVPLEVEESTLDKCKHIVKQISANYRLRGSNGADIVISSEGEPNLIEINPRFQGTIECVERVLRSNLVKIHVDACVHGLLPKGFKKSQFFSRLILYCKERKVAPDLSKFRRVRDIPLPGAILEQGEPMCSVISEGVSPSSSYGNALSKASLIYNMSKS